MKSFKAFIKPLEAPQRRMKIKIELHFFTLSGTGTFSVNSNVNLLSLTITTKFLDGWLVQKFLNGLESTSVGGCNIIANIQTEMFPWHQVKMSSV